MNENLTEDDRIRLKMYSKILEETSQAWGMADLSGMIINCNSAFVNLIGYTLLELKGVNYMNLIGEKYRDMVMQGIGNIQKTKKSFTAEVEFTRKDGTLLYATITVNFLYDEQGIPQQVYAFLNDVTERKAMEHKIEEHAEELEKMNTLMVGREVAMVNLKEKVKKLEQQLSEKDRTA